MSQLGEYTFELIWQAIKGWDIQREPGRGYANATGDDVRTVVDAIAPLLDAVEACQAFEAHERLIDSPTGISDGEADAWWDERQNLYERRRAALAVLDGVRHG